MHGKPFLTFTLSTPLNPQGTHMNSRKNPVAGTRRFAADRRCESQLTWLMKVGVLAVDTKRPPSYSQLIRRAIGLLTDHVADMINEGKSAGLPGLLPADAARERAALEDYFTITNAELPASFVDTKGLLKAWAESLPTPNLGLAIPVKERE